MIWSPGGEHCKGSQQEITTIEEIKRLKSELQPRVLNDQRDECLAFNTACIESRRVFRKLTSSPSRGPLLDCRRNPAASATKKSKAEDISPPSPATCETQLTLLLHRDSLSM